MSLIWRDGERIAHYSDQIPVQMEDPNIGESFVYGLYPVSGAVEQAHRAHHAARPSAVVDDEANDLNQIADELTKAAKRYV